MPAKRDNGHDSEATNEPPTSPSSSESEQREQTPVDSRQRRSQAPSPSPSIGGGATTGTEQTNVHGGASDSEATESDHGNRPSTTPTQRSPSYLDNNPPSSPASSEATEPSTGNEQPANTPPRGSRDSTGDCESQPPDRRA
ncbi:hypothetical protein BU26DRAFT_509637 [Trematosphaeria pertusa]|uniref:Uncharacterized protein n=1 Tax=Trematosphaeria pertusa TaxID=390896 RepID=A0A6A6I1M4_9PLEO|nr:uncharacterized protein BU26DRAFT_509637 [Trematosphaeria pertusa]KAF2243872.1 hypothetical protein BU26DRAFT_509637 [Trematosphaeria pertusa]